MKRLAVVLMTSAALLAAASPAFAQSDKMSGAVLISNPAAAVSFMAILCLLLLASYFKPHKRERDMLQAA